MNIKIKNYNGIESLEYELIDGKINFLFGISGSGKSSIANALTNNECESHVTVGKCIEDLSVLVNDSNVEYDKFKIFDMKYMENILINKTNETDVFTILYGDGGDIQNCRNNYNCAISDLLAVKNEIVDALKNIGILAKELKLGLKNNNTQLATSSLSIKMEKNATSIPKYRNAITYSTNDIKWLIDGTNMQPYINGKCPFCTKKMTPARINKINEIINFDSKTYEKINSQTAIFSQLNITRPNWTSKSEVKKFNNTLIEYLNVKSELEKFNTYIDIAYRNNFDDISIVAEKPTSLLKKLFPNVYVAVVNFNNKLMEVKKALGKLKVETQKVINGHSKVINDKLNVLGIPYHFIKKSLDDVAGKATYCIVHNNDVNDTFDRVENLSFGEKNLIGLILFLLANSESHGLVIDDPASSFDEYRRKVIFDIVYDLHKTSTVLILSHDHIFAKYAVFHLKDSTELINRNLSLSELKRKFYNETGNINFLENYGGNSVVKNIEYSDFDDLEKFVDTRLLSIGNNMNYQVAINLRLKYELKKRKTNNSIIYGYLSSIIHKTGYSLIMENLEKIGKKETDILRMIKEDTSIDYSPLSKNYIIEIDNYGYLDFEKIVKCREEITNRSKKGKIIKDELSNIIHMNSSHAICLDPYKFNYFSKYVKDFIDSH